MSRDYDLSDAVYALERMTGSDKKCYRVGELTEDLGAYDYRKGEVVLFCEEDDGIVALGRPLSPEEIEDNIRNGSSGVIKHCLADIPKQSVREVQI